MGRSSRTKWENRIKAAVAAALIATKGNTHSPTSTPWYESNLLWGAGGFSLAITLTVVALMKADFRWLLFCAVPFACLSIWPLAKLIKSLKLRILSCVVTSLVITGGFFFLYFWIEPPEQRYPSPLEIANEVKRQLPEQKPAPSPGEIVDELSKRFPTPKPRSKLVFTGYKVESLNPGHPIKIHIQFMNVGQISITAYRQHSYIKVVSAFQSVEQQLKIEDKLVGELRSRIRADKKEMLRNILAVGNLAYTTMLGHEITPGEIKDIKAGKSQLYFLGTFLYKDANGSRESNYCLLDQATEGLANIFCRTHNDGT